MQAPVGPAAQVQCVAALEDGAYEARVFDLRMLRCEGHHLTPQIRFTEITKVTACGKTFDANGGDTIELAAPIDTMHGNQCTLLHVTSKTTRVISMHTARSFNVHLVGSAYDILWDDAIRRC